LVREIIEKLEHHNLGAFHEIICGLNSFEINFENRSSRKGKLT